MEFVLKKCYYSKITIFQKNSHIKANLHSINHSNWLVLQNKQLETECKNHLLNIIHHLATTFTKLLEMQCQWLKSPCILERLGMLYIFTVSKNAPNYQLTKSVVVDVTRTNPGLVRDDSTKLTQTKSGTALTKFNLTCLPLDEVMPNISMPAMYWAYCTSLNTFIRGIALFVSIQIKTL